MSETLQTTTSSNSHQAGERILPLLALSALGIVYGDIGTSPLYAFREAFQEAHGISVTPANVIGVLSLIFWSLIIIISGKYLIFVLRADYQGEGGILALTTLITSMGHGKRGSIRPLLIILGLLGIALLYGDGIITPAISVLSAVEGLRVANPLFEPFIIPITIGILVGLFLFRRRGAERISRIFGPITLVWFLVLALLGIRWIVRQPAVLAAVNPLRGLNFFLNHGWSGFLVLGSVFLVVTGGELLYANLGDFGKRPIRLAWFTVVLPALLLNYFGQGALLLAQRDAVENPFYHMAPPLALYPIVLLATAATVIASQALITGVFSLTRQAVQLSYLPRVTIDRTWPQAIGQIYIPVVNWALLVSCIGLVLVAGSSSRLAAAYGVAISSTMVITTLLLLVARERWHWSLPVALLVCVSFLVIDVSFWTANLVKIPDGGWFPLVVGVVMLTVMTTWKRGRELLQQLRSPTALRFTDFVKRLETTDVLRVSGTAIYLNRDPECTPPALIQNLQHNYALHDQVILLSVKTNQVPYVTTEKRVEIERLESVFYRIVLCYGFMESPDVPRDLALAKEAGLPIELDDATYFLGRERLLPTQRPGMAIWREKLFALMNRNARNAADAFRLPPDQVVELGVRLEL